MASSSGEADPLPEETKLSPWPHHTLPAFSVAPAMKEGPGRNRRKGKRDQWPGSKPAGGSWFAAGTARKPQEDLELDQAKAVSKEKEKGYLGQLYPVLPCCTPGPFCPPPTAAIMTSPRYSMTNSFCSGSIKGPFWMWLHFLEDRAPPICTKCILFRPKTPRPPLQGGCLPSSALHLR